MMRKIQWEDIEGKDSGKTSRGKTVGRHTVGTLKMLPLPIFFQNYKYKIEFRQYYKICSKRSEDCNYRICSEPRRTAIKKKT